MLSLQLDANTSGVAERSRPLNVRENYRLGWTLMWPLLTVCGVALALQAATFWGPRTVISQAAILVGNFALAALAVLPWTIRRAIQTDFPGFHVAIQRAVSDDLSRSMTYRESLGLSWRLAILPVLLTDFSLDWIRSVPATGPGAGQIVLGGILAVAISCLPAMAARELLLRHSTKYSLQIVRKDSIQRDET